MIQTPLSPYTDLRPDTSQALEPASSEAVASASNAPAASPHADTAGFLSLLADERYRFPPEHHEALCEWVAPILARWPGWPAGVQLRWDASGRETLPGHTDSCTEWVLRLGPAVLAKEGKRQTGLQAQWEAAHPATSARPAQRPRDSFTPQPGDPFDALAQAASDHWSARTQVRVHGCEVNGMELRRMLVDCLQSPAGRRWQTPVLTRPTVPTPPHPGVREMRSLFRPWLGDGPSPAKQPKLALLPREPALPVDDVGEAIRILREGGWCAALEHVVPSLVTRLPVGHLLHKHHLEVFHQNRVTVYGPPKGAASNLKIFREDGGRLVRLFRDKDPVSAMPAPDAFLRLLFSGSKALSPEMMPAVREVLANLIACNPLLVRVGLALFKRNIPGDQEVLQRLCLVGKTLTIAGEQLLDSGSAQRDVVIDDLNRWYSRWRSARQRTPESLRSEGISILDAHRFAGPMRPTPEGSDWLKMMKQPPVTGIQDEAKALLEEQLPTLRYAYQAIGRVVHHLAVAHRTYHAFLSEELKAAVDKFCKERAKEDLLVLPPDAASSPLAGSSASCM
ncbi:hypothetical protein CDN98_08685 [Roseateles terrae]|nr:hypothetical protein CDN98_08685 [Roseateles terrae]